eukprot:4453499-Ditylum_brightwellii.AAC.1
MPGLDECDCGATEEADDSNFDSNEEVEEDVEEEEEKYVVDEDPNHPSYNLWVPGAGPVKTPDCYRFGKDDAIEHFKSLLDGDYTAWSIFHEVLKSYVQLVHENTKAHVRTLPDIKESWDIHIEEIWI